jgi:hypothetical protein
MHELPKLKVIRSPRPLIQGRRGFDHPPRVARNPTRRQTTTPPNRRKAVEDIVLEHGGKSYGFVTRTNDRIFRFNSISDARDAWTRIVDIIANARHVASQVFVTV